MNRGFANIAIIVALVVVVAGAGWWYMNKSSAPETSKTTQTTQQNTGTPSVVNNQPTQPAQTSPAPSAPAGMKTYSNSQYGFTMQYPAQYSATSTFLGSWSTFSGSWNAYMPRDSQGNTRFDSGTPIVSLFSKTSVYTEGQLLVGISSEPNIIAQCTSLPPDLISYAKSYGTDKLDIKNVTINKAVFYHFASNGVGMGHVNKTESYRTVRNGLCYAIDIILDGSTERGFGPDVLPTLEQVVQTFRFNEIGISIQLLSIISQSQAVLPVLRYRIVGEVQGNTYIGLINKNSGAQVWGLEDAISYPIIDLNVLTAINGSHVNVPNGDYFLRLRDWRTGVILAESVTFHIAPGVMGN